MRKLLFIAVLVGLTGCGAPTRYGKLDFFQRVGYSDRMIGEGVWEVAFKTLGRDVEDRYQKGALYRSAELARDAGFPFFQVVRFRGELTTEKRPSGPVPVKQVARLTVRGVRTRDEELKCESSSPSDCGTFSTEATLRAYAPLFRQPPAVQRAASPIATDSAI